MKTFTYKNRTFEKAGTFKKTYGIKNILFDKKGHIQYHKLVMEINYEDFYKFGNKDTDVFKIDDGRLCVPVGNRLLEFQP